MTAPPLDHAVLRRVRARIAQLDRVYDCKIGQSGQSGHRIENAQKLRLASGRKARSYGPKLATVHRPVPAAGDTSRPIGAAPAHLQRALAP
jgi:hypothetical protein